MKRIVDVEARTGYRVWIRFADGIDGEIDLSDLVGSGVFKIWQDPSEFRKVVVDRETGTIAWPGGIDLCPDTLYEDVIAVRTS